MVKFSYNYYLQSSCVDDNRVKEKSEKFEFEYEKKDLSTQLQDKICIYFLLFISYTQNTLKIHYKISNNNILSASLYYVNN